jgi:hypothetical protein
LLAGKIRDEHDAPVPPPPVVKPGAEPQPNGQPEPPKPEGPT